jgi:hypothetical protein
MRADFQDDEAGQEKLKELRNSRRTGERFELSGENLTLGLPAIIDQLTEQILGLSSVRTNSVELGPIQASHSVPVRVEVENVDGESFTLPYVDWRLVQSGTHELTLSNAEQPIPILVTQVINHENRSGTYSFELRGWDEPLVAPWLHRWLWLQHVLEKPSRVAAFTIELETPVFIARRDESSIPVIDEKDLRLMEDLASVQLRTGSPVRVPNRPFSTVEVDAIKRLRKLLRVSEYSGTWSDLVVDWPKSDVEKLLARFEDKQGGTLELRNDESLDLFGETIELGPVLFRFDSVRLTNEDAVRQQLDSQLDETAPIECRFEPADNAQVTSIYEAWTDRHHT